MPSSNPSSRIMRRSSASSTASRNAMSTDELKGASLCERRMRRRSCSGVCASASKIDQFVPARSTSALAGLTSGT